MKTINNIPIIFHFFLFSQLFFSCQKEKNELMEYEVNFGINQASLNSGMKSAYDYDLRASKYIIITIKRENNESTRYTSSKIDIYQLNGNYYSHKILLSPGLYKLTEFLISDSEGNILFAVPTSGSMLASGITDALPISFSVEKNKSTSIKVEVISTEGNTCEDFGPIWFRIREAKVLKIPVAIVDQKTSDFLSVQLIVYFGAFSRNFKTDATANNLIVVPDGYSHYNFRIIKPGFYDYIVPFTQDSLKMHTNIPTNVPLIIEFIETINDNILKDADGNFYKTLKIGNQIWMAENLKTTHYYDGSPIPNITENDGWLSSTTGAYCWLYNDKETYGDCGILYNAYAFEDTRKLVSEGWHVPSYDEWLTLFNSLGGPDIANPLLLKNGVGFNALIFGSRLSCCNFVEGGNTFWTSTLYGENYYREITIGNWITLDVISRKNAGFSIRFVKN